MKKLNYNHTIVACFIAFGVQALVVNFLPLLFLTFKQDFKLSVSQLTMLITTNFVVQIITDVSCIKFIKKYGQKPVLIFAHFIIAVGFIGLSFFTSIMPPHAGLLLSVVMYAIGGGIIEVIVSPIVEACPTENKSGAMSLLHSFYCWGHLTVVLLSTLFFAIVGIENWRILACIWASVPFLNCIFLFFVPVVPVEHEHHLSIASLAKNKLFWIILVVMVASGASEQAMAQWISTFAEHGLGVSKMVGDIAGPLTFALCMAISRTFYGKFSEKINLQNFMLGSGLLCIVSYMVVAFSPVPLFAFIAAAVCGLSVGIMWPGTLSLGTMKIPTGGTSMFALFALGGDVGCTLGPTLTGLVFGSTNSLQNGFMVTLIFPVLLIIGVILCKKEKIE